MPPSPGFPDFSSFLPLIDFAITIGVTIRAARLAIVIPLAASGCAFAKSQVFSKKFLFPDCRFKLKFLDLTSVLTVAVFLFFEASEASLLPPKVPENAQIAAKTFLKLRLFLLIDTISLNIYRVLLLTQ